MAVAVVFTTGVVLGQAPQVITLQDAIELALENNFSLKQAENNLELADNRIISEYADFLPSISSSAGYSKTTGQQFVQDILAFDNVTSQGASGRIGGDIIVFNGLENLLSLRQSEYDKLSFEETVQRAREDVVFNTASAYLTLLVNQELLDIAIDNLETSRIVLEQTTAQVEVGARAPVDQFNQESTVATNELTVIQRENQVRLSKVQLVRQLQIDPLGDYEFERPDVDPANYTLAVNAEELELRDLIQEALETRSDIKSEEANIESQELDLLLARSNFLPTISASASISTRWSDPYFLPDASFGDQFFDQQVNKGWGFSINLPLFQNMNRVYSVQSATVQLKNAELSLENSKLAVVQEVTQAFNDFIAFTKQLESAEKALIASEKALETQQERYNVGASTLIELSEAQSTYVSAQSDYTQAQFNLIFQEKLLDYYLGKLNHTNIEF
ncbi:MAG: TolC family protein [Balneolales bacterium]|nr:TolC family protein [Balneolales bacterium]